MDLILYAKVGSMQKGALNLLKRLLGRAWIQPLVERFHLLSLAAMNIGRGADPRTSGEKQVLETLTAHDGRLVVLDVGANRGAYAQLVFEVHPGATVYSFEPSVVAFNELVDLTIDAPGWFAFNIGLSDAPATLPLHGPEAGSELSSLYARDLPGLGTAAQVEWATLESLDNFCRRNSIESIDLLKLDAEGHEVQILQGARDLLDRKCIRAIQFEFGGSNVDSRTFLRDFFKILTPRYRIFRVLRDGLRKVDYNERWEMFMTTNFVAIEADDVAGNSP